VCLLFVAYSYGYFWFSFQVHWPLSIVLSRKALTKYQLIFRFLFHCKHVDRQLCGAWQTHQVWLRIPLLKHCLLFNVYFVLPSFLAPYCREFVLSIHVELLSPDHLFCAEVCLNLSIAFCTI